MVTARGDLKSLSIRLTAPLETRFDDPMTTQIHLFVVAAPGHCRVRAEDCKAAQVLRAEGRVATLGGGASNVRAFELDT